jgi:sialic acid synthase SpsE
MHLACCPFGGQWIATHDAMKDVMYAFVQESEHDVWREQWYTLMSRASLQVDLYITCEDQVFNINLVVMDSTWGMVAMNVINRLAGANAELMSLLKSTNIEGFMKGIILF